MNIKVQNRAYFRAEIGIPTLEVCSTPCEPLEGEGQRGESEKETYTIQSGSPSRKAPGPRTSGLEQVVERFEVQVLPGFAPLYAAVQPR